MQKYQGQNGQVIIDRDQLILSREGLIPRMLGLRSRTIPLRVVSDVAFKDATPLINGYIRLGLGGASARALQGIGVARDPDAILFRHKHRPAFRALHQWLLQVVDMNRSGHAPENGTSRVTIKWSADPKVSLENLVITHVPRTAEQLHDLVSQQPPTWEYLLFAGVLLREREVLELKWRDHDLRYARRTGRHLEAVEAANYLVDKFADVTAIAEDAGKLLSGPGAYWERAFGPLGKSGDAARIEHLGRRLMGIYEALLDWSAELRSLKVPAELERAFELAARLTDMPVHDMRQFVDLFTVEAERLSRLSSTEGEPIVLHVTLTLTTDDYVMNAFIKELNLAKQKLGFR